MRRRAIGLAVEAAEHLVCWFRAQSWSRVSSQVLGDGALLGGGRGAVVSDHARRLPPAGQHRLGGAGAARSQLAGEADAPGVPGDPPCDAGGPCGGGEAARDGLAVEAAEHLVCRLRAQP